MFWRMCAVVAVAALAVTGSALAAPAQTSATTLTATLGKPAEFKITLSKLSVAKGTVTFKVTNKGSINHDLKIAGKRTKVLGAGKSATLSVTLKPGKYPFLCTLPGHAAAGMKGTLTVK